MIRIAATLHVVGMGWQGYEVDLAPADLPAAVFYLKRLAERETGSRVDEVADVRQVEVAR